VVPDLRDLAVPDPDGGFDWTAPDEEVFRSLSMGPADGGEG
jgi:hypothetical protein